MKKQAKEKRSASYSSSQKTDGSIVPATLKAFCLTVSFWICALLNIVMMALTFASPYLLGQLISFTSNPNTFLWQGVCLSFSMFFVSIISSIISSQYSLQTYLVGFRIRTCLVSAIYRKALKISSAARKDTTAGEIVNLMAVDAQRFYSLVSFFHVLWSGLIVMGIAIYQLWDLLGMALISGLVVMVLTIPLTGVISAILNKIYIAQMEIKDERVKSMNEVLNGMKVLKLYAWEPSFEQMVLGVRGQEVSLLRKSAIVNAGTYFVWILVPFFVTLASFITFVLMGNVLTPTIAFVSLSLFNILRGPMGMCKLRKTFNSIIKFLTFLLLSRSDINFLSTSNVGVSETYQQILKL